MKKPVQDEAFIAQAYRLFDEFCRDTRTYREKCRQNEQFWRANHWSGQTSGEPDEPQPVTPVLFSTLESVLADVMDNYPEAVLLGEQPEDDKIAGQLTQLVRYVLKRRHYRSVYRGKCRDALMKGASVQEVFWDDSLLGGLGDVNVRAWDIVNFAWDPKFEDVQDGRACFKFGFYPLSWYEERYPNLAPLMNPDYRELNDPSDYVRDDKSRDVMLLEYWFRERDPDGGARVHLCKLAGGVLLEDSRLERPEGMYAHGLYPFVVEPLYPLDGQPVGLGLVDILQNLQEYADRLDQIILKNALLSGKMKLLVNRSADIDEASLMDCDAELVRGARIDDAAVRWMQTAPLSNYVLTYQQMKLQSIKEESGQNLFNRGETSGGITAASAILALQEAGSKRSRVLIDQFYDGFERLVRMLVSVVQENYDERRVFRVGGEDSALCAYGGDANAIEFDVSVHVQKQTAYTTIYQNELALQLLSGGVIEAQDALEMMTFEGRESLLKRRRERLAQAAIQGKEERDNGGDEPDGRDDGGK